MDASTAARIASLKGTPAWDDLKEWLGEIDAKYWRRLQADMQSGKPLDQREIDYARGIQRGIRSLLAAPEKAGRIYERQTRTEEVPVAE